MPAGSVVSIHLVVEKGGEPFAVESAQAEGGRGLVGDRYESSQGDTPPKRQTTLIAAEAIDAVSQEHGINLAPGASRRNITTRGVELNPLVGKEFSVGEVRLRGIDLCAPCGYLEKKTEPGVRKALANRGGLRAEVLSTGIIRVGDPIRTE